MTRNPPPPAPDTPSLRMGRRRFLRLACGAGALGLLVSYPVWIERYWIVVNRYRIRVPNLPPAFAGITMAQLTDLHYGLLVPISVIRWVVRRTNRLGADVILLTGDYVHERQSTEQIDAVWPALSELAAPEGVYAVLGNHDHWADTERSQHWLDRTGWGLRHRALSIEREGQRLWLAGAGDLYEDHRSLDPLLDGIPTEDCRVVLAHNPDTADMRCVVRIDAMISGHTHGGQVKLPFVGAPVVPVRNKAYVSGLVQAERGFPLFISRGIGWAIYPVRFNCLPEIAVIELVP